MKALKLYMMHCGFWSVSFVGWKFSIVWFDLKSERIIHFIWTHINMECVVSHDLGFWYFCIDSQMKTLFYHLHLLFINSNFKREKNWDFFLFPSNSNLHIERTENEQEIVMLQWESMTQFAFCISIFPIPLPYFFIVCPQNCKATVCLYIYVPGKAIFTLEKVHSWVGLIEK